MVKHSLHFFIDGERIDYTIYYQKETGDEFPKILKINRISFTLVTWKWIFDDPSNLHLHAYYHGEI